ncbi:helix-turn-helix transcriptional regulator [Streptomyces europaeiscabiei]|uniref:helix-turn-helix domain-containing protein n=1 Tax=Streptomyces europaeiscabiei TaxID=146819 RepID=UPI0029BB79D6|nr:helix-turn-helix transcriptional regulator [Streptomyces europaeiscabiei]MDX3629062.1 helix-turn-helix transcriptional regulator [Streptomyces europaeiscabiei]MDX3647320.1 helix-turn-helix transcriptional regulator [Streptomyces europaeiscabiei]
MPQHFEEHTGARIARARKSRHLTQRELADRSHVSYSTITKLEQGRLSASPAIIGALARSLSVPVSDLTGQPYVDELRHDQLDGLIQPIREALDIYDLGPDPDVAPRSLDELHGHAQKLCALVRATDLKTAAAELPGLIHEATAAAYAQGSDRAWQILASTYRTAYDVTTKLGYGDLCTVALDRVEWAAQRASDPVLSGMRQYMRALVYLRAAQYGTGQRLIRMGMSTIQQAEPGLERDVVTGQLHLGAAVLSARSQDGDTADGHLAEAERIAGRTGEAAQVQWMAFGPTNVGVHRVSTLAERDLYPEAVEAAKTLALPDDWPPSRMSHHYAEVARAQLWMGRTKESFDSLRQARKVAPQQTRYHPLVRETFAGLTAAKRAMPETFTGFAAWLGV